jgi:ferredoxin
MLCPTKTGTLVPSAFALSSPFGSTSKNVATQVLQGAGPPLVDLNQYNLHTVREVESQWTLNLVQKATENQAKVVLGCKSPENFVDRVSLNFDRIQGASGIGLTLVEVAGGRQDGLGLTLVSEVTEGGAASGCDILPGDSVVEVGLVRCKKRNNRRFGFGTDDDDVQQVFVKETEGLSYDATVDAIRSLPAPSDDYDDKFVLELKRIRRKPKIRVKLQYPPSQNEQNVTLELFAGENLRHGMLVRGVKLNDPLAKRFDTKSGGNCGAGGLCRTCSVTVQSGMDLLNPQRLSEKQMLEDSPRWRLACKAIVGYGMKEGDMVIRVNPRQW